MSDARITGPTFPPLASEVEIWIAATLEGLSRLAPNPELQDTVLDRMRWVWWDRVAREQSINPIGPQR